MLVAETYREAGEETNGCGDCVLTRRFVRSSAYIKKRQIPHLRNLKHISID